jgi:hypothetical protein
MARPAASVRSRRGSGPAPDWSRAVPLAPDGDHAVSGSDTGAITTGVHASSGAELVLECRDEAIGYHAFVVIHSTACGPAMRGIRRLRYPGPGAALADAVSLARGMTYKTAFADLPFGGAKSVIHDTRQSSSAALHGGRRPPGLARGRARAACGRDLRTDAAHSGGGGEPGIDPAGRGRPGGRRPDFGLDRHHARAHRTVMHGLEAFVPFKTPISVLVSTWARTPMGSSLEKERSC